MVSDLQESFSVRTLGQSVVEVYCEQCRMFTKHQAGTSDGSAVNVCLPCMRAAIMSEVVRFLLEQDGESESSQSKIPGIFPSLAF